MHISYSICSKLKTLVGVAFTGVEWERLCQDGDVIDGLVPEPVKKFNSARGESSNAGACSEKNKNTNVQLVGEMHRLKEVLEVNVVLISFGIILYQGSGSGVWE
ncbi:hypothetical protein Tco_0378743 [Tanacetum coccineum]